MSNVRDDKVSEREPDNVVQYRLLDEQSPSMAVVSATAELRGCEPTELDTFYTTMDPDALDALASDPSPATESLCISFEYEGVQIEVQCTDQVTVVAKDN